MAKKTRGRNSEPAFLPVSGEWTATAWNTWAILDLILVSVHWERGEREGEEEKKEGRA